MVEGGIRGWSKGLGYEQCSGGGGEQGPEAKARGGNKELRQEHGAWSGGKVAGGNRELGRE